MSEILSSDVLVVSRKGKLLGIANCDGVEEIKELVQDKIGGLWTGCSMRECLMYYPLRRMLILRYWVCRRIYKEISCNNNTY